MVLQLIGKNALKLKLPSHMKSHQVAHVSMAEHYRTQPQDIGNAPPMRSLPIQIREGAPPEFEVAEILSRRRKRNGFQWLALLPQGHGEA